MNLRFIDWIWHIRGSVPLAAGQSSEQAFERLEPLFRERDTHHVRNSDTLTFEKSNQAPQDKMSIFDGGELRIEQAPSGGVLRYDLTSKILLFCFLAPFLFLSFGQLAVAVGVIDKPTAEEKAEAKKKEAEEEKRAAERKLHPIDQFLGAPEPEKPKTEAEKKKEEAEAKAKGEDEEEDEGPSPTPAYVFAGIFAALYLVGRVLEDRLVKRLFARRLQGT
ncbi:MAG: hypothetical protein B7Z08_06990 [Sphingomonadales bacterium 32-68-7]|nr:MAG: hypothetical protein B7Z33_03920 [Sphingomonadales bacterium 12-68-11]OYX08988.1 MAG: hypothetical protein B7Z08_06990 [Sphingomonadales bacterium 32-68-7]